MMGIGSVGVDQEIHRGGCSGGSKKSSRWVKGVDQENYKCVCRSVGMDYQQGG